MPSVLTWFCLCSVSSFSPGDRDDARVLSSVASTWGLSGPGFAIGRLPLVHRVFPSICPAAALFKVVGSDSADTPNHLLFALNDSRLVVSLTHSPVIVFEASHICSPGDNPSQYIRSFQLRQRLPLSGKCMRIRAIFLSSWPFYVNQMAAIIASWRKSSTYQPCSQSPDGAPEGRLRPFQPAVCMIHFSHLSSR
jgi:hypothetical protein